MSRPITSRGFALPSWTTQPLALATIIVKMTENTGAHASSAITALPMNSPRYFRTTGLYRVQAFGLHVRLHCGMFSIVGENTVLPAAIRKIAMKATIEKAWGYQGDAMNLPVRDVAAALPFYETVLGFSVLSRSDAPRNSVILSRDQVQIGLAENGGDPTQDGCAFHVKDVESLFAEFNAKGLDKKLSDFTIERRDGAAWKVFYVVAPDGLCYWFGERQAS